jgi:antitoxin (DNA-binding transcriptional repressor) of toxin-antitoxin stability system
MSDKKQIGPVIGTRQLVRQASDVLDRLKETGEPVIITRFGTPVATLSPVGEEGIDEFVAALAPTFQEAEREADEAIEAGTTKDIDDVDLSDDDELALTATFDLPRLGVLCNETRRVFVEELPVAAGDPAQEAELHELKEHVFALYLQQALEAVETQLQEMDHRIVTMADASPEGRSLKTYKEMLETVASGKTIELGATSKATRPSLDIDLGMFGVRRARERS